LKGRKQQESAQSAKDRLQILLTRERADLKAPDYFPQMREEIIEVIRKYIKFEGKDLELKVDQENGMEVLELNLTIPQKP
jgi:cell division topological specificity factor